MQARGDAVALGVNYEVKNNPHFQPPFAVLDLSVKHRVARNGTLALSVENLLNTNNYGMYVPIVGAGTPRVGNTTNAAYARLELRIQTGR